MKLKHAVICPLTLCAPVFPIYRLSNCSFAILYFYPNRAVNDGLPISLHTVAFIPTIEVRVVTAN